MDFALVTLMLYLVLVDRMPCRTCKNGGSPAILNRIPPDAPRIAPGAPGVVVAGFVPEK